MMKTNLITAIKIVAADRMVAVLTIAVIVAALAYSVYVGVSLHPSDLQVAVHYTAFGETSFYREKWYYLISFFMFGVMVAIIHTALILKLYTQERRQMAILFGWLSLLIIVIAWATTRSVLGIAFL
ncbi:MAG TPA: hypothetical protein VFZ62_04610 [Candidatus Saccharimonadales bacterium]